MNLQFTKMHGLGNDFMVIDAIRQSVNLTPAQIARLSRRDVGVGFDQCLLIEESKQDGVDFFYRIYNADGQEVGQCGNGARCLARFVQHYQLSDKRLITVATHTTRMELQINEDETVTVNMGQPELNPVNIPLHAPTTKPLYSIPLADDQSHEAHAISVGNPHAISIVADLQSVAVETVGKAISEHPFFPEQANAGFMQIISPEHIKLRVYERGCGETQACGSGAVAAAVVGRLYHQLAQEITVSLPGGDLTVFWPDVNGPVFLTGPAAFVYEARLI